MNKEHRDTLHLVLARDKLRQDEAAYQQELQQRKLWQTSPENKQRGSGCTGEEIVEGIGSPTVAPRDSQTLRKFKMHMRESYQFLPKKILSQLYGDMDFPDPKTKPSVQSPNFGAFVSKERN